MGIFGGTYSLIVMTGLHQSFPAIETQLLSAWTNGIGHGDFIFVVASMANVVQGAATFAIWFLTKNSKTKVLLPLRVSQHFLELQSLPCSELT